MLSRIWKLIKGEGRSPSVPYRRERAWTATKEKKKKEIPLKKKKKKRKLGYSPRWTRD